MTIFVHDDYFELFSAEIKFSVHLHSESRL